MRMRQMTENVTMTSTAKVAILASLNIIDELFSKTGQLEEMEDAHQVLLASLADRIDDVLAEGDPSVAKNSISEISKTGDSPVPSIFQKSSPGSSEERF
jgi:cell division protein ZapA (FtsZ GTPase activity inhibitor)